MLSAGRTLAAVAAAGLLTGLAGAPAALAQDPTWEVNTLPRTTVLASLGVPETDDVRLQITCDPDYRFELTLSAFYITPRRERLTVAMAFDVDGTQFVRGLRFTPFNEFYGGYAAEVVVASDDPLLAAMRAGSQLSATLHPPSAVNNTVTISLAGSAVAIDTLLQQCGHERS
ncbi:MAG: hypothetical protein AcusKO_12070 [Acuticoccus sp.]